MSHYEIVAGLEVHAQLNTRTKAFCRCLNRYGAPPNTLVCPVCLGAPGALPVLSRDAVEKAVKLAKAIGATVHFRSRFDRKNYFYPDLPKGYQISQFEFPIATGGFVEIALASGSKRINITRAHLEEDAGKSMHLDDGSSIVDLNRCGVPLVEIVTEPDFCSASEAGAYLSTLRELLRFIDVCDGNMDEGSLRCDANVSVRRIGEKNLRERCEMKNLNSIRGVEKAIEAEARRQIEIYESGGRVHRHTLHWNEQEEKLYPMRTKEGADDYRYFPEPDLPELVLDESQLQRIYSEMPVLPGALRKKYREWGLNDEAVYLIASDRGLNRYFESLLENGRSAINVASWVQGDVQRILKERNISISEFPITPQRLGSLIDAVESGRINRSTGKDLLRRMLEDESSVEMLIENLGVTRISDSNELSSIVRQIVDQHPIELQKYRQGKTKMIGFFMGQIMQETHGQADPVIAKATLMSVLELTE